MIKDNARGASTSTDRPRNDGVIITEGRRPRAKTFGVPGTLKVISLIALLIIWQIASQFTSKLFLPSPGETAVALYRQFAHGDLGGSALYSLRSFLIGFASAAIIGVAIGIIGGYIRVLGYLLDAPIDIFWATPVVALIPVMVLWIGLNLSTQLIIVFLSAVFPIIMNTQTGVRTVDKTFLDVAASFGKSRWYTFSRVIVPAAAPHIGAGLRLGVGRAIIGVYVAEIFTSSKGLGARMNSYATLFQTPEYFAALVVFIVISVVATAAVLRLTRKWSRWRVQQDAEGR